LRFKSFASRVDDITRLQQDTQLAVAAYKMKLVEDVRLALFRSVYPLPHRCKRVAWALLIAGTALMIWVALMFGIQFDADATEHFEAAHGAAESESECWRNYLELRLEYARSRKEAVAVSEQLQSDGYAGVAIAGTELDRAWRCSNRSLFGSRSDSTR
jgi:hypothetical protein